MIKKLLYFSIIFIISICLLNFTYATELTNIDDIQSIDNTLYSSSSEEQIFEDIVTDYEQAATTTTTDYESEAELTISNIINIILISVGIVLILLGIAIILKLK